MKNKEEIPVQDHNSEQIGNTEQLKDDLNDNLEDQFFVDPQTTQQNQTESSTTDQADNF